MWSIYTENSQFLFHINILNSYEPFSQVWITTSQEIWSDHQKGKMVKIRVLTEKAWFWTFNPNTWLDGLRHDIKNPIASFWPNYMVQNIARSIGLTDEFFSQLIKNQLYTEKSNFDFLVKIKCKRSQVIKTCQNMKLIHQKIKKSRFHFEKSKFLNLEIFLCWKFHIFS